VCWALSRTRIIVERQKGTRTGPCQDASPIFYKLHWLKSSLASHLSWIITTSLKPIQPFQSFKTHSTCEVILVWIAHLLPLWDIQGHVTFFVLVSGHKSLTQAFYATEPHLYIMDVYEDPFVLEKWSRKRLELQRQQAVCMTTCHLLSLSVDFRLIG
jgi:hypothetical protein